MGTTGDKVDSLLATPKGMKKKSEILEKKDAFAMILMSFKYNPTSNISDFGFKRILALIWKIFSEFWYEFCNEGLKMILLRERFSL